MKIRDPGPLPAIQHANRALEDVAAHLASESCGDRNLEMLLWLVRVLRAVADRLGSWARTNDNELRHVLVTYGHGLVRLRRQLASLEAVTRTGNARLFINAEC